VPAPPHRSFVQQPARRAALAVVDAHVRTVRRWQPGPARCPAGRRYRPDQPNVGRPARRAPVRGKLRPGGRPAPGRAVGRVHRVRRRPPVRTAPRRPGGRPRPADVRIRPRRPQPGKGPSDRPRHPAAGPPRPGGRRHLHLHPRRVHGGRRPGDRVRPGRRRVPGEPVPAADRPVAAPAGRPVPPAAGTRRRAVRRAARLRGVRARQQFARTVLPRRAAAGRPPADRQPADQGHPPPAARHGRAAPPKREGPSRVDDDRRPPAERLGPHLRSRLGEGHGAAGDRGPPDRLPRRGDDRGHPAAGRRVRRHPAGRVPVRVGHRVPEDPRDADHRRAGAGPPGAVLRGNRVGRAGRVDGVQRRDPHDGREGRDGPRPGRRRDRGRFRPGGRVRGDAGQGGGRAGGARRVGGRPERV
ncbi:MAG: Para-aminobenzoate synthase, aminase component, partial [uncultured Phycisphaerae bacterium]